MVDMWYVAPGCWRVSERLQCENTENCYWTDLGYPSNLLIRNASMTILNSTCADVARGIKENPDTVIDAELESELCEIWCGMDRSRQKEECSYDTISSSEYGMGLIGRRLLFDRSLAGFSKSKMYYQNASEMDLNHMETLPNNIGCQMCSLCSRNSTTLRGSLSAVVKGSMEKIQETCVNVSRGLLFPDVQGYCEQSEFLWRPFFRDNDAN